MKQQVVVIHGGDSFASRTEYLHALKTWPVSLQKFVPGRGWKSTLPKALGTDFQILTPQMPNKSNARYLEWKIWFDRMLPYVKNNVILVGHSLGGMFLAKYLAEKKLTKKVKAIIFVAAPHNKTADIKDFRLPKSLARVGTTTKNIFLFHSPNDPVVPISELHAYGQALPQAKKIILKNRGHFNQERFPELVRLIKQL